MHFEEEPAELRRWVLGIVFGLIGIATLVVIPTWFCAVTGELNVGIPVLALPVAAFCLQAVRILFAPQMSIDLEQSPRTAHVLRMNLLTRRRRKHSYPIPDDACVILEESDCEYSLMIRLSFFRTIHLPDPSDPSETPALAVNVARFLHIEVEDRRPLHRARWKP